MRIAITGSNGQLGTDLCEVLAESHQVLGLTHAEADITNFVQMEEVLERLRPEVVINTAAFHNVPKCEEDPDRAYKVNGSSVLNLSKLSNEKQFIFIHFSTDYVFDGKKKRPYVESDSTNPLNVYAVTKLAGENFVRNYCERGYIIRVSGIYGRVPSRAKGGNNFITTMIRLAKEKPEVKVVTDEILTPTSTTDIASNTRVLIENIPPFGIYHMTNEGECSWYDFAKEIFRILDLKTPLNQTSVNQMPATVKRPYYSVLHNDMLIRHRMNIMPHWKDSLEVFLRKNF